MPIAMFRLRAIASSSRPLARLQSTVAAPSAASASPSPTAAFADSPDFDPTSIPAEPAPRYSVERTSSGQLPVYTDIRNGGNNWRTIVRKVTGDVRALQDDLNDFFAESHIDPLKPAPRVILRPTNKHLEVRGRYVEEVKTWLEARGF